MQNISNVQFFINMPKRFYLDTNPSTFLKMHEQNLNWKNILTAYSLF